MNKVYRVIFNRATQTWTAVAEFAKAHGKSAKTVGSGLVAATLAISSVAQAAVAEEGDNATAATSAVAVGDNAAAVTEESIAIGANTKAGAENNFSNWANLINPATKQKFTSEQELRDYFAKTNKTIIQYIVLSLVSVPTLQSVMVQWLKAVATSQSVKLLV
ncbi:hypothetical protein B0681_09915 [Moraxella porci DSM 25326]|uniref:ESPR domain-containing protein n=1 Tax=Moraxella porci DSM 25326 TaxID=573983 RepID=A0A1T0CLI2_9GAMM|nr:ESPR domain-containing protein [Moraxella porci]OOS23163.1 hypothetical protein B0681_09915 [Moraxella porci DSM 25326]